MLLMEQEPKALENSLFSITSGPYAVITGSAFSTLPMHDLFLPRQETFTIVAKILCSLALAIQVLCRVTLMRPTFKIKVILN